MTNLTCFWHPVVGVFDLTLNDVCKNCGKPMDYPLTHLPTAIEGDLSKYKMVRALDRGYYGATYIGESRNIGSSYCIKIIPKEIYRLRGKDFAAECVKHAHVAQGTQHLVGIVDFFDSTVAFGDQPPLDCHVAVLEYVKGPSLKSLIEDPEPVPVTTVAQIALDMMNLLADIEKREIYHNDLHSGNILVQKLARERVRSDATIDPAIRLVAVDLGSVTDFSRSMDEAHMTDAHHITEHLTNLIEKFEPNPETASAFEYRMGLTLSEVAAMLRSGRAQGRPSYKDLADQIQDGALTASAPWRQSQRNLGRFNDSYNAQTMMASLISKLLVDPAGQWQNEIASPGPLLVTGMRGCGKTMLLRSCQFHVRAHSDRPSEEVLDRLRNDSYVGLYVSCQRLLDPLGRQNTDDGLHEPHARLFLRYAREALQALLHLRHIDPELCAPLAPRPIASVILERINDTEVTIVDSIETLDRKIERMLRSLEGGERTYALSSHPAQVMPDLANAIRTCSPLWTDAKVLYLLDDVSTRHLNETSIRDLVSSLMFNDQNCAFKMTTETQTFELVLKSPGLIEQAQQGRDYRTFDLAGEINASLRHGKGGSPKFIADVLEKRARLWRPHPAQYTPAEVLGQSSTTAINKEIASKGKTLYHGIQALGAVCVGDVGDVITIYESIVGDLLRTGGTTYSAPASKKAQSDAFLLASSKRKYYLSGRDGRLTAFSDGFAEAAHKLLVDSYSKNPKRLRDYGRLHVRVSTGDIRKQLEQLRELVDAGVFVLAGGPDSPRVKNPTAPPHTQMILIYRKLLGLGQSIGLGQRDRFELDGEILEEWLANPERTSDILLRNLAVSAKQADTDDDEDESEDEDEDEDSDAPSQFELFSLDSPRDDTDRQETDQADITLNIPQTAEVALQELARLQPGVLVGALGFEERCLKSVNRLLKHFTPPAMLAAQYPIPGHGDEILDSFTSVGTSVHVRDSRRLDPSDLPAHSGIGLVDVTGLSKALIYQFVRAFLLRDKEVLVAYTGARDYYPLDADVQQRLTESKSGDDFARLQLFTDILTGEGANYDFHRLESVEPDDGRLRALMASSSPKHRRLGCFLEERTFDQVGIIVPDGDRPRDELAKLAARVATDVHQSPRLIPVQGDDLQGMVEAIAETYWRWFHIENYNFEVGLTGSKMSAIAFAAASSVMKFSEVWYVAPQEYDQHSFTLGAGPTHLFHITIP